MDGMRRSVTCAKVTKAKRREETCSRHWPEKIMKKRVVALIQARMGSTRLPGKVLRPIAGKPLLWHIVHRLRHCTQIEDIAIATSTNPRDDAIVEFGASEEIMVLRGRRRCFDPFCPRS